MDEKEVSLPASSAKEDEAYAWVVRLDSDQRTHQDELRFDQWLEEDPANRANFETALELWEQLGALKRDPEAHAVLGHLYETRDRPQDSAPAFRMTRRALIGGGLTALAASLGAMLVLPRVLTSDVTTYETAKGEQRRVTLADGSTVVLDTATKVEVDLKDDQRRVTLERGQAFFQVAHDPTRPFRVFAGADEVRALGTAFEVRFEQGQTRVILEEGRVAVYRGAASGTLGTASSRKPDRADAVLVPGQSLKLATSGDRRIKVASVDLAKTNAWRDGDLVFDDVPLASAVAEVNRYGGREIILDSPELSDIRISGSFHTNRPEAFVEGITAAFPVRLRQADSSKLILSSS